MKKAIIYVRGHKQEMQEVFCKVYAADQGYNVLFVTSDIKAVRNCDVLLVSNHSRISRDKFKYYKTILTLKARGIRLVSVSSQDDVEEILWLTRELMK